jgi:hypothetical protein
MLKMQKDLNSNIFFSSSTGMIDSIVQKSKPIPFDDHLINSSTAALADY